MATEILQCPGDRAGGEATSALDVNVLSLPARSDSSLAPFGREGAERDGVADVRAGDLVRVREGVWRVMEVRAFARPVSRARVLRLIGADAMNRSQPCTLLEPFDRPVRVEAVTAPRVVSRARWMRTCAALLAASPPPSCPATIADAHVTLMPHQIDPVLAVLRGCASRLLLADAVGLGKTIQAALLLRELRTRGCADRVLILTPSGLRNQWRQELSHRAGLHADIIDAAALAARTRELPPDINPWSLPGILIVSLDFIKQPSVLHGADTIPRDLLIVDEAHNLNEGTDRLAAADLLARHSRHVVLLTATPHHGSDDAFNTLCGIGRITDADADAGADAVHDDPIVIFRRTRETMGLARTRKVHVLRVTPTTQERRLHTLLARYVARVEREQASIRDDRNGAPKNRDTSCGGTADASCDAAVSAADLSAPTEGAAAAAQHSHPASLAMSVLLKRASSSASSLERSLRCRLTLLDERTPSSDHPSHSQPPSQPHSQPRLPFGRENDDGDDLADGEPSHVLGAPGLRSARIERAWLTLLIEASRNAARAESKPRVLARLLRRCREPALIYTEYRDTLTHLARTLGTSSCASSYALLHGGLPADARRDALARFASGDARILLTTDAAGEGLNLHQRCRLVVNIELPWNPNRLEQRIGRVDRLGQTRTVHVIHLVAAETAEEHMLTRLTGRVERIAAALGDAPAVLRPSSEMAVEERRAPAGADALHEDAMWDCGTFDGVARDSDGWNACRLISPAATEVAAQLESMRALRARATRTRSQRRLHPHGGEKPNEVAEVPRERDGPVALRLLASLDAASWSRPFGTRAVVLAHRMRTPRCRALAPHAVPEAHMSTSDPLAALDERAPLITVMRRRRRGRWRRESLLSRFWQDMWSARASPCSRASGSASGGAMDASLPDAPGLDSPGLLCIWRAQVDRDDEHAKDFARSHPPSPVLIATHIACDIPRFAGRAAIGAFVTATIARCRERLAPLLDRELAAAREHFDAADRERIERLTVRSDAIEAALAATLRARATASGALQPLLFDDITSEKMATSGELRDGGRSWMRTSSGGSVRPDHAEQPEQNDRAAPAASADRATRSHRSGWASELTTPSLAMVLVIR